MDPPDANMNPVLPALVLVATTALLPSQPPPQPVAFRVGAVRFDRPEGWSYQRPPDGVRAAQLEKKVGGVALLITLSRFTPGSGGSVQANVDRWIGQFRSLETPASILRPEGTALPLTTVKLVGTLRGGTPGGPAQDAPGTLLLGALLESPDGLVVAKMVGPKAVVTREEKVFTDLVGAAAGRAP